MSLIKKNGFFSIVFIINIDSKKVKGDMLVNNKASKSWTI